MMKEVYYKYNKQLKSGTNDTKVVILNELQQKIEDQGIEEDMAKRLLNRIEDVYCFPPESEQSISFKDVLSSAAALFSVLIPKLTTHHLKDICLKFIKGLLENNTSSMKSLMFFNAISNILLTSSHPDYLGNISI